MSLSKLLGIREWESGPFSSLSSVLPLLLSSQLPWSGGELAMCQSWCVLERILSSCFLCLREQSLYTRGLMSHFDPSPRRTVIASEIAFHSHPGLSLFKRRRWQLVHYSLLLSSCHCSLPGINYCFNMAGVFIVWSVDVCHGTSQAKGCGE